MKKVSIIKTIRWPLSLMHMGLGILQEMHAMASRTVATTVRLAVISAVVAAVLVVADTATACTRILYNDNPLAVLVSRSMDWWGSSDPTLYVLPRGMRKCGADFGPTRIVTENAATWTSRYGSVVATMYGMLVADGINEKGLAAHGLWLQSSDFGARDTSRAGVQIGLWVQYVLDNAATVKQAIALQSRIQPVLVSILGFPVPLALSIEDRSGDSAIVEFVGGQPVIYHGRQYRVAANIPEDEAEALLAKYDFTDATRNITLPGNSNTRDRFIRASFYSQFLSKTHPRTTREATAALLSVARNVSDPIGAPGDVPGEVDETDYRTVSDLTHRIYYIELSRQIGTLLTDLRRLDFLPGAGPRWLNPNNPSLQGDVTGLYRPCRTAPLASIISFTRFDGTNGHIFTMAPDGSDVRQVTFEPGVQAHSALSPEGIGVVYSQVNSTESSIQVAGRTGGPPPRVLNRGHHWSLVPHWSPDGSRIAFTSDADGNYEIYTMKPDGTDVRQLTFTDPPIQHVGPKYSPDGKLLLYATDADEKDPANQQDLWVMPSGGGAGTRLTYDLNNRESRSWSPDGTRIVTQTVKDGVGQLVVLNADGTGERQITHFPPDTPKFDPGGIFPVISGAVTPAWSPDGKWIAFASNHKGTYDIYRIRPDGSGLTRITNSPQPVASVGWWPIQKSGGCNQECE